MKFSFLLLFIFFLFTQQLLAQSIGGLKGVVSDHLTKEPIAGATIYDAKDITIGTVSEANGNFELKLKNHG